MNNAEAQAGPSETDLLCRDIELLRFHVREALEALSSVAAAAQNVAVPDRPLATLEELAEYCQIPPSTVYQWSSRGGGPKLSKVGRHLRARWSDIEEWLDDKTIGKETP